MTMDFSLTDEQLLVKQSAAEFADDVLAPAYEQIEIENNIPDEIIAKMAECEFAGLAYP